MAKKRTSKKPSAPAVMPMMERMQNSGMMKAGDMMMSPSARITSMMQKPSAPRKPAGGKGRRK